MRKTLLLASICLTLFGGLFAQKTYNVTEVQQVPQFPGGDEKLAIFLSQNIKYPYIAVENGIQGTVAVSFVVDTNGAISQAKCIKSLGAGCDEAALKVVKSMPRWSPGTLDGKKVRVSIDLPIRFHLYDDGDVKQEPIFSLNQLSKAPVSAQGNLKSVSKYLSTTVKLSKADRKTISGKTIPLSFIIRSDGSVESCDTNGKVNPAITAQYCAALQALGKWIPGEKDSKAVAAEVNMAVAKK